MTTKAVVRCESMVLNYTRPKRKSDLVTTAIRSSKQWRLLDHRFSGRRWSIEFNHETRADDSYDVTYNGSLSVIRSSLFCKGSIILRKFAVQELQECSCDSRPLTRLELSHREVMGGGCLCIGHRSAKVANLSDEAPNGVHVKVDNFVDPPLNDRKESIERLPQKVASDLIEIPEHLHNAQIKDPERIVEPPPQEKRKPSSKIRLLKAAKSDNVEEVAEILVESPDCINETGMWGNSALLCACQYNCPRTAMYLLEKGADVSIVNEVSCTALHHACLEGMTEVVRKMVPFIQRLPPNSRNVFLQAALMYNSKTDTKTMLTPLLGSSVNGHYEIVSIILGERLVAESVGSNETNVALEESIAAGQPLSVSVLLRMRKDLLSHVLNRSVSYLILACKSGNLEVVRLLLDEECAINGCLCAKSGSSDGGVLAAACRAGDSSLISELVHAGADPNYTCGKCSTPLMEACRAGDLECVQALVTAGAHPLIHDPESRMTAIEYAKNAQQEEILEVLQR